MYIGLHPIQKQFQVKHLLNLCFPGKFDQCLVFDRLLPVQKKKKIYTNNKKFKNTKYTPKYFMPEDKMFFFKMYCDSKEFWEEGVKSKSVGRMMYMLKGKKYERQRHHLRPRYTGNVIKDQKVPVEVIYNVFNIHALPISIIERRTINRKRK